MCLNKTVARNKAAIAMVLINNYSRSAYLKSPARRSRSQRRNRTLLVTVLPPVRR